MQIQSNETSACALSIREIKVGAIYKHYSGKRYKVIAIAHDSEDPLHKHVVYQSLYDCSTFGKNAVWARPYTMFAGNVIINGAEQLRFEEATEQRGTTEDIFHLGLKAIIKNKNNKILVLRTERGIKGYWDLPGGRVQTDENHEDTLRREVFEETGITLHAVHNMGMITSNIRISIEPEKTVGLIFSFYVCTVDDETVLLSDEHQQYEWVSPSKAIELLGGIYGQVFTQMVP